MKNGECEHCTNYFDESDCKEATGCGCHACYDVFKNGDCPECGNESDVAEKAHENMLSDFYGGSAPFTARERQDEALKAKAGLK